MFYWSHRGTHILLTDEEVNELLAELGASAVDRVAYYAVQETRQAYEKKIFQLLRRQLRQDPAAFQKRYVLRCWHDDAARRFFPHMLDAYGGITGLAAYGSCAKDTWDDRLRDTIAHGDGSDLMRVSLFSPVRFRWRRYRATGRLQFSASAIETVTGAVNEFSLIADGFSIRFGEDGVVVRIEKGDSPTTGSS